MKCRRCHDLYNKINDIMNEDVKQYMGIHEELSGTVVGHLEWLLSHICTRYCLFIIIWMSLLCLFRQTAYAQQDTVNLSKVNRTERMEYLLSKAREVVLNFGPKYFNESYKPHISRPQTYEDTSDSPEWNACNGRRYYKITYSYDKSQEMFYMDFASDVYIWEDNG